MEIIGIIAEYSPFHNGHMYHIKKIKETYKDSLIILVLNGYFLERGSVSLETKEEKTRLALKYGVDLVIELPFIFGTNSADIFAEASLELLNELGVNRIIFGSESNDISLLYKSAEQQLSSDFDMNVKKYMDEGLNYPTALTRATGINIDKPNDLLGISYIKAILKNNYSIKAETIKRTNDYLDTSSDEDIISASNIREKINNGLDIKRYIPEGNIVDIDYDLMFKILKHIIIVDDNLKDYLSVDEGLDNRLRKVINDVNNIEELILKVKTKRYTYNRLMRMFIHILIGLKKIDKENILHNEYIRILGLNSLGQKHINSIKKELAIPIVSKFTTVDSIIKDYEIKAANFYQLITNENVLIFEEKNKPIIVDK